MGCVPQGGRGNPHPGATFVFDGKCNVFDGFPVGQSLTPDLLLRRRAGTEVRKANYLAGPANRGSRQFLVESWFCPVLGHISGPVAFAIWFVFLVFALAVNTIFLIVIWLHEGFFPAVR